MRSAEGPSSQHQLPQVVSGLISSRTLQENSDLLFFDRVKRALENRETYNEFLKLNNLFTQRIIDTGQLIKESRSYLGDTELLKQFQAILGFDERKVKEQSLFTSQNGWTRPVIAGLRDRPGRININTQCGSYRKLPENVCVINLLL
jgi:paired amphipathic helix protein Sin3a